MKFIKISILSLFLTLVFADAKAQNSPCGTDKYMAELLKTDPQLLKFVTEYNDQLSTLTSEDEKQYKKGTTRIIPVVFHIIHTYGSENISKDQIDDQIRIMNEDYQRLNADTTKTRSIFKGLTADMDIEFRLARIDPNGNCTEGVTRTFSPLTDGGDDQVKKLIRWDYRKYLNIWVIKNISMDAGSGGRVLGYATLPAFTNSTTDGIVMLADYVGSIGTASGNGNKGRVLVHEAGHWLGLYHPFQNGCGSNCSNSGDFVCDTPPVSDPSFGCPTSNNTCNNDSPDVLDMVENYMDYANGTCQNMFTKGQKSVVDNSLGNNNYRARNIAASNITATGALTNPSCAPIADFYPSNNILTVCQGQSITFKDYTYNGTVTTYAWTFDGGSPGNSALANPVIRYDQPGQYKVTLAVTNSFGTNTKFVDKMINVIPSTSPNTTPISEGFESATVLTNSWYVSESGGDYGWKRVTTQKYEGSACLTANIDAGSLTNSLYNLISPPYDVSAIKGRLPKLKFRVAYRPGITGSTEVLTIWVSKDCGQTWTALKAYSNATGLGVDKVVELGWAPATQADWKELSLDLVNYESVKNLMVKFEARSRSGNSIYLDNVNISADLPAGTGNLILADQFLTVSPNPSNGAVDIAVDLNGQPFEGLKILNTLGQEIHNLNLAIQQNGTAMHCSVNNLSAGIYYAQLNIGGQKLVKKFIIIP